MDDAFLKTRDAAPPLPDMKAPDQPALSTDYLNLYAEVLMLIEMVGVAPELVDDLKAWSPVGYVEHFERSALRCAPVALEAYAALDPTSRRAFETLCSAMNRLVETVVLVLQDLDDPGQALAVVDVAAAAFRNLLTRATAFINSAGDMRSAAYDTTELQDVIDRIIRAEPVTASA